MTSWLKKYFIPNASNDFNPRFFSERSVLSFATVIVFVFFLPFLYTSALSDYFAAIIPRAISDLTNANREEIGIASLTINSTLEKAAKGKAEDMAKREYFAHMGPDGKSPWQWFVDAGYRFSYAGENLAVDFSDSDDVIRAWMNSPGHRINMLNASFTEIGIGTARGKFQGKDTIFVVQMFGRPASAVKPVRLKLAENEPEPVKETIAGYEVEVIAEDDKFIAVKTEEAESAVSLPKGEEVNYASQLETLASSPRSAASYIYYILGAIVALALILDIFIEIKRQHPLHYIYATCLILLIGAAIYINEAVMVYRTFVL